MKISQISLDKTCVWSLFLLKFTKKRLQHKCFLVKFSEILRTARTSTCERLFLRIPQEELVNSTSMSLHFNECLQTFHFFTLGSVSQHGTLKQIMSNTSSFIYDSAGGERTKRYHTSFIVFEIGAVLFYLKYPHYFQQ